MQLKRFGLMVGLACGLVLSGCGGKLQIGEQARPGSLGTATSGIEPKVVEEPTLGALPLPGDGATVEPAGDITAVAEQAPPPVEAAAPVAPAANPTADPVFANVQLPAPADLETRWRNMQVERAAFEPRAYVTPGYQIVWWFDPVFGQVLPVGQLRGEFTVQATFRIKGQWIGALELPYHVNQQYGITVPPAIHDRMKQAGVGEWAEVFIYETQDTRPK